MELPGHANMREGRFVVYHRVSFPVLKVQRFASLGVGQLRETSRNRYDDEL